MTAPDGLIVVDKPTGPTSHDVVAVARRGLRTSRVGHTGTLDPMASGVLVLLVGRATRLARFMSHDVKAYTAHVTFGRATSTYDAHGETTSETGRCPSLDDLAAELARRVGPHRQTPPAFSAKKVGGDVAYEAARRQQPLTLAAVEVVAHEVTLVDYTDSVATLALEVSAGYYVRSLAHDLGVTLATGAHLSALRRTHTGPWGLEQALPLDVLAAGGPVVEAAVVPMHALLPDLPAVTVSEEEARAVGHGRAVRTPDRFPALAPVRLIGATGRLIAVAEARPMTTGGTLLQPFVVVG